MCLFTTQPNGTKRLSAPNQPPDKTEPHELEIAQWLIQNNIKFKWFRKYEGRKSPDIFIGEKSVELKTLLPPDGKFRYLSLEGKLLDASLQSRRAIVDATQTDLIESLAVEVLRKIIDELGSLFDELVILVSTELGKLAVGWHRA